MKKIKSKTVGEVSLSGTLAQRKICAVITDLHIYGYSRVEPFAIGRLEKDVKDFAKARDIKLESDYMYMTVKGISHALRETKRKKGITVSIEELAAFPIKKRLMDRYYDTKDGNFIYVSPTAKYVVTPNYEVRLSNGNFKVINFITATKLTSLREFGRRNYIKINGN